MNKKDMIRNVLDYFWLVIVLIPFFGGIGFIYAGWRSNETKWMDEGIIYMIPFILMSLAVNNLYLAYLSIALWIVGIIRAILILKEYSKKLNEKYVKKDENDEIFENNYKLNKFYEQS